MKNENSYRELNQSNRRVAYLRRHIPMSPNRKSFIKRLYVISLLVLILASCNFPDEEPSCESSVYVVTHTEDTIDGVCTLRDCSLREAILMANFCDGQQGIYLPSGLYTLTRTGADEDRASTGDLDIRDDLILEGERAVVDGGGIDRVIHILGEGTAVEIRTLTIQNGVLEGFHGGGILNEGDLSLSDVVIARNEAIIAGGIHNDGVVDMIGGRVESNLGVSAVHNSGEMALHNVEVQDNSYSGAGDYAYSAIENEGYFTAEDVTITGELGNTGYAIFDGAILESSSDDSGSTLRLERVDISGFGWVAVSSGGQLTIIDSSIHDNPGAALDLFLGSAYVIQTAIRSNGTFSPIYNRESCGTIVSSGVTNFTNVTISGNGSTSTTQCFTIRNTGSLRLLNVTLFNNEIPSITAHAPFGRTEGSPMTMMESSIMAGNAGPNCSGEGYESLGHNLFNDETCGHDLTLGDIVFSADDDLLLGPLADNGGPTLTHALLPGSPAIDAAGGDCPAADQRGVSRPQGDVCDIGAFELEAELLPPSEAAMATFMEDATCRLGPGTDYDIWETLLEGQQVLLQGRNSDSTWWWLLLPDSEDHCWVSDAVVEVIGPVEDLPIIIPPEPPQPTTPPATPTGLVISDRVCAGQTYSVTLGWTDNATNETGYRVFRDGQTIASLGANATGYTDNPPGSGPYTYSVQAFNAYGASGNPEVEEEGCLF
jgi:CSLREA domain-containing protein